MSTTLAYYVPTIPDVWSTDRYQHALGLIEASDKSILIGNKSPPAPLRDRATHTHVLEAKGVINRAREAATFARGELGGNDPFITSYHYEAALSGLISKQYGIDWVADVYETPAQYRLNQPRTYHQITSRGLEVLLNRSDRTIHSFHPDTPYQYGEDRRFLTNGAPTSRIGPKYSVSDTLDITWVGSPRFDRGGELLVRALAQTDYEIQVEVYGSIDERLVEFSNSYGVRDQLSFHGWVNHKEALEAIQDATVGFAVLPPRTDWIYAPAIKIGEYLAGGTIPLVSTFPGSRFVAADSGVYTTPDPTSLSKQLSELILSSPSKRRELMKRSRKRGEEIPWESVRSQFAREILLDW